ncbi:MAG: acyltransferase, partial [Clostridia bacterium]|nr:acyltransferase [Clostridia bacterium]
MSSTSLKKERNYGIDLLRIVSMLMVVTLHTLNFGGILHNVEPFSFKYYFNWFLYLGAYCAVNCYGLIAGYVGYGSKSKYSNLINLYLQTLFYSLFSAILYF